MHSFTVAIINGSYMFQLQRTQHQAVYMRSIKANHIPVVYMKLKLFSGRHLSITYTGT